FDIFDESLQAKMGLYDSQGRLLMQTDNSDLPLELPPPPSLLSRVFPSFSEKSPTQQAQVYSSTGYTLLYESRLPPKKPVLSSALNLFTGTLLLLFIMAGVLWWIARTITWRINQMSQQMTQLGDGDFTVRVNVSGNDEITSLACGFNQAAQKIEQLIDANNLLLAHASHELRTPITRIRLQIEMMDMLTSALPSDTKAKFDKRAQAVNRDLSGLNDLVESILLVSRMDAGHALQQVERLDLYDLVNQERQHYPEATLIGEHVTIDGQAAMLTHLIRNLLTNAMLHGKPPVTVLLYGVQMIDEAGTIPDYLLQTVLCDGLIDCNGVDFESYDEPIDTNDGSVQSVVPLNNTSTTSDNGKTETTDSIATLPAPLIYKNGESIIPDTDTTDHEAEITLLDSPTNKDTSETDATKNLATHENSLDAINEPLLSANHHHFTNELTTKIKKSIWKAVPDTKDNSTNKNVKTKKSDETIIESTVSSHSPKNSTNTQDDSKNNTLNTTEALNTPRKEGLFAKHMKKAKAEPVRPLPKYAVLAVIDEGTGIPEDKREEVFSPFVRLQQKNKGSGLGLSLVSQIVTAHQGRILTDTLNGHTRFLVIIPVKHDPNYQQND
ncbi:MAG: HAMP domain-containing sensor histidine kinase, partial [Psychrobacter sp.]